MSKNLKTLYPNQDFSQPKQKRVFKKVPQEYQEIYSVLSKTPQNLNSIASKLHLPLSEIQSKLTLMELDDLVCKVSNNSYIRA